MLSLKKRGKIYHFDIHLKGNRYRGSTYANNKDLAMLYARKVYDDIYQQKFGIVQPNIILVDVIETHLRSKQGHHSEDWLYINHKLLDKFSAFIADKGIDLIKDVTTEILEAYKSKLLQSMKPISVKNNFRVINALFNYAIKFKYISENPAKSMTPIRGIERNKQRYLSKEEIEIVVNASKGTHLGDLVVIALYTGMRRRELVYLEYGDIDLNTMLIYVRNKAGLGFRTKSRKERTIPIHEKILPILSRKKEGCFFTNGKKRLTPRAATEIFSKITKGLGMEDVGLHTLRHTFASYLAMSGVSLWEIAKLLGHSSTHVTELYSHLSPNRREINKLNFY